MLFSGDVLPARLPYTVLMIAARSMPIMTAWRIHGARKSGSPFGPNWMSMCS